MHTDPALSRHASLGGVPLPKPDLPESVAPSDPRPVMTEKELSLHKAVAGNRAAAAVSQSPESLISAKALLDAASGPMAIAGMELKPITLGTLKTLRELGSVFVGEEVAPVEEDDICLAILVFSDPKGCWTAIRNGQFQAVKEKAENLAFDLSMADLRAAGDWINGQLAALNQLSGDGEDHLPAAEDDGPGKPAASCG